MSYKATFYNHKVFIFGPLLDLKGKLQLQIYYVWLV
jgi:hypothetical protein